MTREEAIMIIGNIPINPLTVDKCYSIPQYQEAKTMAIEALENQKIGHWIDDDFGSKCSCCGIHTHLDKFDRPMKFKHCSMCGAKMEGE